MIPISFARLKFWVALILTGILGTGSTLAATAAEPTLTPAAKGIAHTAETQLLNERTRDITGANLVAAPGLLHADGITGRGEVVALADSGLDKGNTKDLHPDFRSKPGYLPKVLNLQAWAEGTTADNTGHGTHMAGIIAGTGAASDGKYRGMAPDASLYIQAILNRDGQPAPPADLARMYYPAYSAGAAIQVNGWGTPGNRYNYPARETDRFMANNPGFLAIFAAGNTGPEPGTLTGEANSKNALVVGAAGADFSSRGPTSTGRIKPDLLAPGTAILSTATRQNTPEGEEGPYYQVMQGTSMAAAVAGGAAALLRQYFRQTRDSVPSAALLKAALINGARLPGETAEPATGGGFGVLDVGRTILALREGTFQAVDNPGGLQEDETLQFTFRTWSADAPVKVTLVWSDPVDADGRLVNDLDLTVLAPDGSVVAGNRHLGLTGPDRTNNVEQIYLPQAPAGRYTVRIHGIRVGSGGQPFALVMGQPLTEPAAIPGSTPPSGLYLVLNDRLVRPRTGSLPAGVPPGVHLYQGPNRQYGELRVLRVPGIDVIPAGGKSLVVPVTSEESDGGYTLATGATVTINSEPRTVWPREAKGAVGTLWLNPADRQVYQVRAEYLVVEGKLRDWPAGGQTLTLIDDPEPFTVPPGVAVEGTEEILGGSPLPGPLLGTTEGQKVGPGSLLRLLVNPVNREVTYIEVRRMAVGGLVEKNTPESGLIVEGIGQLELTAGCRVQRDGEEIPPDALRPGDYIQAFIQPPEQKAIGILATGRALWGKILYISAKDRIIYFSDQYQRVHRRAVKPDAVIHRWDFSGDLTTVPIGGWGWFTLAADGQIQALRLLETGPPEKVAIEKYNPLTGELVTTTDEHYCMFSLTAVNRDGLPVPAGTLRRGETVEIIPLVPGEPPGFNPAGVNPFAEGELGTFALTAGTPSGLCLAGVTAANRPSSPGERPALSYMAIPMGEQLIIIGQTTGTELYIYPDRGNETITVPLRPGGQFTWLTYPQPGEEGYQLVATGSNGGAVGRYVTLPHGVGSQLTDIADYPAAPVIEKFVRQGMIKGYPDKTFRPNWEITRQELAVLFARTLGWTTGSWESERKCEKMAVAAWAQNGYAGVLDRDLFYNPAEDPTGSVTQSELQIMAGRLLRQAGLPTAGTAIWTNPDRYFGPEGFTPENPVTRAAAVLVLNETLKEVSQGRIS